MNARQNLASEVRGEAVDPQGPLWRIQEGLFFSINELRKPAEEALGEHDLNLSHFRAMGFIYKFPGVSSGEMRRIYEISSQALQKVLADLIRRGLVGQATGMEDRRIRHLYLTDSGTAIFEAAVTKQFDIIRRAARAVGEQGVRGFLAMTDNIATGEAARSIAKPLTDAALAKLFED